MALRHPSEWRSNTVFVVGVIDKDRRESLRDHKFVHEGLDVDSMFSVGAEFERDDSVVPTSASELLKVYALSPLEAPGAFLLYFECS